MCTIFANLQTTKIRTYCISELLHNRQSGPFTVASSAWCHISNPNTAPNQRKRAIMDQQLSKEAVLWKKWSYARSARPDAKEHSNSELRTRSMPQFVKQPTAPTPCPRSQSAAASTHEYPRLPEDAAITNHRTVDYLRTQEWEQGEKTITSAFFLVWAVSVVLLGGWHAANLLSASVVHVTVAVVAASCIPVAISRINRQAPDGVPCLVE